MGSPWPLHPDSWGCWAEAPGPKLGWRKAMDAESESEVPAWCPGGCGLGPWDSRGSRKVPWVS